MITIKNKVAPKNFAITTDTH